MSLDELAEYAEKIKEADVEDLMQTETMNEKAAQAVYAFFHSAT